MIELFKISKRIMIRHVSSHFDFMKLSEDLIRTRDNKYKIVKHCCHYDLKKFNFTNRVIMAALCNRADHYIFALWFLSSIYLSSFFPRLISAAAGRMSTILWHMVWP